MNPGFGGVHPEPIAKYLGALAGAISSGMGNFGLATDGDADRIGAMDERGNFVDPHKIMALALHYLVEKRGWTGAVVRTVSTTRMIDRLAKRYGLKLYETPVGFNHIADYMMSEDVLIGGEESGGISFKGHIPEGDGPIMGLLLVEIIAASGKTLHGLVEDLLNDVGPAFYERTDLRLNRPVAKAEMTEVPDETGAGRDRRREGGRDQPAGRGQIHHGGRFLAADPPVRNGTGFARVCRRPVTGDGEGTAWVWGAGGGKRRLNIRVI